MKALGTTPGTFCIWMTGRLADGAGSVASVTLTTSEETYVVLTEAAAHRFEGRARSLRDSIQQLPGNPEVEWVRPLTRQLQRLLGWGDILSTKEDVARACRAGDFAELRALMPQAEALIEGEDLEQLPALHDVLRDDTLALEGCNHEFEDA